MAIRYDVAIIGAGHNGLVAACYLGMAGKKVVVLEASQNIGGASISACPFDGYDVRLSRYAYLLSLFPDTIMCDLGLKVPVRSRSMSSYTPYVAEGRHEGLHIARKWDAETEASFERLTGEKKEALQWRNFYHDLQQMAKKLAPTLLSPLQSRTDLRNLMGMDEVWRMMFEQPIGEALVEKFQSDLVRGVILTDAMIGTHTSAYDLQANRCLLYHVIGNGMGEWKVPVGGMQQLIDELKRVAMANKVKILTDARVTDLSLGKAGVELATADGTSYKAKQLLCNAAQPVLAALRGLPSTPAREGCQTKINILLEKLPRFRSGVDPSIALAGTLHIQESFRQLEDAFQESEEGKLPRVLPFEMYCHSLTDPTILSKSLQERGMHALTIFVLHTPAKIFDRGHAAMGQQVCESTFAALNDYLIDPIESCLARMPNGAPCVEILTPHELEAILGLPRGNIFHSDLSLPFLEQRQKGVWGVETDDPRILLCGSSALRGGGVSGIPGHNAAMAVLQGSRG